jgi:hypothetical protein
MKESDLPATGHFVNEKDEIMNFLQISIYYAKEKSIIKDSKEDFLKKYPENESDYERSKHFVEVFNNRNDSSYFEFAEILRNEYGYILDEIKEQKINRNSKNINTIKNILVFFTWLWSIGTIITIIVLLV